MPFLRHTLDPARAIARPVTAADIDPIVRLFAVSRNQQLTTTSEELPRLLAGAPAVVLDADGAIWATALSSRPLEGTAWLRGLTLANNLSVDRALERLLPAFHHQARALGAQRLYYGGDISSDTWLAPRLSSYGYQHDTYVIIYAKRQMDQPATGSATVDVRRVQASDLVAVIEIDRLCFEAQWVKDAPTIESAFLNAPFFVVATYNSRTIGYAYATLHYHGRQVHLVRIAVHPELRHLAIGVRLLAEVVEYARNHNADVLTLNTQEYNTAARRLYEWFSFRRTGERQLILRNDL